MAAYGVTRHGNFAGRNFLELVGDMDQRPALSEARRKLFQAREERVHPGRTRRSLLLSVVRSSYQPFQVVTLGAPSAQLPAVPLLQDRGLVDGQAAAYVCRGFTCQAPVSEPEALRTSLDQR